MDEFPTGPAPLLSQRIEVCVARDVVVSLSASQPTDGWRGLWTFAIRWLERTGWCVREACACTQCNAVYRWAALGLQGLECHSDERGRNSWSRFSGGTVRQDRVFMWFRKIVLVLVQRTCGDGGGQKQLCVSIGSHEDHRDLDQGAGTEKDEKTTNWRAIPGGRGRAWHLTDVRENERSWRELESGRGEVLVCGTRGYSAVWEVCAVWGVGLCRGMGEVRVHWVWRTTESLSSQLMST